jgi:membrane associated rhomboid family serine protease
MTEFRPGRFEILPVIIKNLLIINGLFFLAQQTFPESAISNFSIKDLFALHTWESDLFKPWQLVTHMFMHDGYDHILRNMFMLWMFGSVLENLWGSTRFITFYLVCGLGAALIHLLSLSYESSHELAKSLEATKLGEIQNAIDAMTKYNQIINTASLGASGAVFGILAAFVYLFPNTYIYLYFLVPVKAKWIGLIYFGFEVFSAVQNAAGDNVARWAHVGGAVVGLIIVITWNKTNKKTFY